MARVFSLKVLAESSGVQLPEFPIACFYCANWLTQHENILYEHASLLIVWKNDVPFACCQRCIKTCAKIDFLMFYGRAVPYQQFGEISSLEWDEAILRCVSCLRKLNEYEKDDIASRNGTVYLIKDSFRAPCCLCRAGLQ
ncbi:putative E6 oncogenic protein [Rhinolophus ferrumequinum papillomavirus 1]|uniref:Protein E6 n=1 Tax=Rhinolophus ferrumequinum papillomavirus 1 TaxID=1464074 RepID=W8E8M7_9PAPI|nr:putative E6 oncogenic protein [Rhinolophus ferrumequinum papillomavirus 1]AHJ81402.1 putative E6 oncogenic protein [Rhinolophus ferrumequinum papillomavirus 1]